VLLFKANMPVVLADWANMPTEANMPVLVVDWANMPTEANMPSVVLIGAIRPFFNRVTHIKRHLSHCIQDAPGK
jgi:hypothetical protein